MLSEKDETVIRWRWVLRKLRCDLGNNAVRINFKASRIVVKLFLGCFGDEEEDAWLRIEYFAKIAKPDYDLYRALIGEFNRTSKYMAKTFHVEQ
jgi:hypothetical protein